MQTPTHIHTHKREGDCFWRLLLLLPTFAIAGVVVQQQRQRQPERQPQSQPQSQPQRRRRRRQQRRQYVWRHSMNWRHSVCADRVRCCRTSDSSVLCCVLCCVSAMSMSTSLSQYNCVCVNERTTHTQTHAHTHKMQYSERRQSDDDNK